MAFVNELVPDEDMHKYRVDEVNADKRFHGAGTISRDWTIDRERDIYLRLIGSSRSMYRMTWSFYWKGELLVVDLDQMGGGGKPGEPGWTHWKIRQFDIPPHLQPRKAEILGDLESALVAYKDGGTFALNTDYHVILEQ